VATYTRLNAKVGGTIELILDFTSDFDNTMFDPYSIDKVEIIDEDRITIIETIASGSVVNISPGTYKITIAAISTAKTIIDKWFFTRVVGGSSIPTTSTCVIRDADGVAPLSDQRKGYAFDNPDVTSNGGWGAILTPDELRYVYGFGTDLVSPNAQVMTDTTLKYYIDNAIASCERDLEIKLMKRIYKYRTPVHGDARADLGSAGTAGLDFEWDEAYDFNREQFSDFMFIKLRRRPIISVDKAKWYDVAGNLMVDVLDWVKPNYEKGSLEFFPNAGSLMALPIYLGQTFAIGKFIAGTQKYPDAFFIDYEAGFEGVEYLRKKWPEIFTVVGKLAAINMLSDVGDGRSAAIASSSIGLAGISESYSTTMSASVGAETVIPYRNGKENATIEWMFRNRNWFIGEKILAVNPKTGKPAYKKILDILEHDTSKKQCYEIHYGDKKIATITEDHSLFVKNGKGIKEIKGKDIKVGTILVGAVMNVLYDIKVKNINKIKRDKMYDLSIEDYENFTDINILLYHNTSAMYGARILQMKDDLKIWYRTNKHKYSGILLGAL